jgi:hypothetical protein
MCKKIGFIISIIGLILGIVGGIFTILDSYYGYDSIAPIFNTMLPMSITICIAGIAIILYDMAKK